MADVASALADEASQLANESKMLADEASRLTDEASLLANKASLAGRLSFNEAPISWSYYIYIICIFFVAQFFVVFSFPGSYICYSSQKKIKKNKFFGFFLQTSRDSVCLVRMIFEEKYADYHYI